MRVVKIKSARPLLVILVASLIILLVAFHVFPLANIKGIDYLQVVAYDGSEQRVDLMDKRIRVSYSLDLAKRVYHGVAVYEDGTTHEIYFSPMSGTFRFADETSKVMYVVVPSPQVN